jgi:hypothetical protein
VLTISQSVDIVSNLNDMYRVLVLAEDKNN